MSSFCVPLDCFHAVVIFRSRNGRPVMSLCTLCLCDGPWISSSVKKKCSFNLHFGELCLKMLTASVQGMSSWCTTWSVLNNHKLLVSVPPSAPPSGLETVFFGWTMFSWSQRLALLTYADSSNKMWVSLKQKTEFCWWWNHRVRIVIGQKATSKQRSEYSSRV